MNIDRYIKSWQYFILILDEATSTRKRTTRNSEENTCISDNGENETSNDKNTDIPPPAKKHSPSESTESTKEPLAETTGRPKRTRR